MKARHLFLQKPIILASAVLLTVVSSASSLSIAWLLGSLLDNIDQFMMLFIMLGIALLVQMISSYGETIMYNRYAVSIQSFLRNATGETISYMPAAASGEQRTGDMLARASSEVETLYEFIRYDIRSFISGGITLILGMSYLIVVSWELTLFVSIGIVIIIVATLLFNKRIAVAHRAWRTTQSEMSVVAEDIAAGHMDVKAMGIEKGVLSWFDKALRLWEKAFYRRNSVRAWNRLTAMLFSLLALIGVPAFCAAMVINGSFSLGMVLAAIQAVNMIAAPLESVEFYASTITSIHINLQRVLELITIPKERIDGADHKLSDNTPLVEMSGIGFSYNNTAVLQDFSMILDKGKTVALVGASGSGKSTVLRLVAGLYEPSFGEFRFGGHLAKTWKLNAMRRHMAYVQQDAYLFPGSLKDNLKCGEDYSDAQLRKAVERVRLSSWLGEQPGGWDMAVGERGSMLSGGLRQRVTIARAILRNPSLMLLDEPTSALDENTEKEVMETIRAVARDISCLIVAHRLSSITFADEIIAMSGGRIVEQGTHEQLMARKGYYYDLFSMQEKES